jgi:hypothetical protein
MTLRSPARARSAVLGGLFVLAYAAAFRVLHPIASASIGPDAAAPVIQFERLVAGRELEGHLTQTAKPLLTGIYGVVYSLAGDWRPVAWLVIGAFALCVVLAAILADRVAGPVSGAFAATAILLSPILLADISLAYAVTWALLFWLIAGLAVTAERPRYALAGVALMLAALARPEAIAVTAFASVALVAIDIGARARRERPPPRSAYLILLGFLAIPILMAHDLLLLGDPLFWANTAQINSEGRPIRGLHQLVLWFWVHFRNRGLLVVLASIGVVGLVLRRQFALAVGIAGAIAGVSALFLVIGARGTTLSGRYLEPIDIALVFAASLSMAVIDVPRLRRMARRWDRQKRLIPMLPLAAGILAGLVVAPIWPTDSAVRNAVSKQVHLHANAARAIAAIRANLASPPSWRNAPASRAIDAHPLVIVPPRIRAQAVVDLGLPLTSVAYSYPTWLDPAAGKPGAGTIVYHDRLDDRDDGVHRPLEIDQPTVIGNLRYVPILSDAADGFWVVRVEDISTP